MQLGDIFSAGILFAKERQLVRAISAAGGKSILSTASLVTILGIGKVGDGQGRDSRASQYQREVRSVPARRASSVLFQFFLSVCYPSNAPSVLLRGFGQVARLCHRAQLAHVHARLMTVRTFRDEWRRTFRERQLKQVLLHQQLKRIRVKAHRSPWPWRSGTTSRRTSV